LEGIFKLNEYNKIWKGPNKIEEFNDWHRKKGLIKEINQSLKKQSNFIQKSSKSDSMINESLENNKELFISKPIKELGLLTHLKELKANENLLIDKTVEDGFILSQYNSKVIDLLKTYKQNYSFIKDSDLHKQSVVVKRKYLLTNQGYKKITSKDYIEKYIISSIKNRHQKYDYHCTWQLDSSDLDIQKILLITLKIDFVSLVPSIQLEERIKKKIIQDLDFCMKSQNISLGPII